MADPHAPTPIRREDHGAVARLVLSSPQNYNALSREMIAALRDALAKQGAELDTLKRRLADAEASQHTVRPTTVFFLPR